MYFLSAYNAHSVGPLSYNKLATTCLEENPYNLLNIAYINATCYILQERTTFYVYELFTSQQK